MAEMFTLKSYFYSTNIMTYRLLYLITRDCILILEVNVYKISLKSFLSITLIRLLNRTERSGWWYEGRDLLENLEVTFDQTLSMQEHVNTISKNCFYYLRKARILLMLSERMQGNCSHFCDFKTGLL